jgi:hypothetical protein
MVYIGASAESKGVYLVVQVISDKPGSEKEKDSETKD